MTRTATPTAATLLGCTHRAGHVTISDPDDAQGMPAYDGPVEDAHTTLMPGLYPATLTPDSDTGAEVAVTVVATRTESYAAAPLSEREAAVWARISREAHADEQHGDTNAMLDVYLDAGDYESTDLAAGLAIALDTANPRGFQDEAPLPTGWDVYPPGVGVDDYGFYESTCLVSGPDVDCNVTLTSGSDVKYLHRPICDLRGLAYVLAFALALDDVMSDVQRRAVRVARALAAYDNA